MRKTFTGHLVKMLDDAGLMKIQVHGGCVYTVDAIPGVKRSTLLAVVKEPASEEVDMVMTMADYNKHQHDTSEPSDPDITAEGQTCPNELGSWGSGCSLPE